MELSCISLSYDFSQCVEGLTAFNSFIFSLVFSFLELFIYSFCCILLTSLIEISACFNKSSFYLFNISMFFKSNLICVLCFLLSSSIWLLLWFLQAVIISSCSSTFIFKFNRCCVYFANSSKNSSKCFSNWCLRSLAFFEFPFIDCIKISSSYPFISSFFSDKTSIWSLRLESKSCC